MNFSERIEKSIRKIKNFSINLDINKWKKSALDYDKNVNDYFKDNLDEINDEEFYKIETDPKYIRFFGNYNDMDMYFDFGNGTDHEKVKDYPVIYHLINDNKVVTDSRGLKELKPVMGYKMLGGRELIKVFDIPVTVLHNGGYGSEYFCKKTDLDKLLNRISAEFKA